MDMNFPHPKRRQIQSPRDGKFAELVAVAVARQMEGVTTQYAAYDSDIIVAHSDPVSARMHFFADVKCTNLKAANGSFMPSELLERGMVNKIDADVYRAALANGKPNLFTESPPEQPVALRGMEN